MEISADSIVKPDLTLSGTIDLRAIQKRKQATRRTMDMRRKLVGLFPLTFMTFAAPKRPLMIGIYEAVIALHPELARFRVREAIGNYVGGRTYLRSMIEGEPRIDLTGEPSGQLVTAMAAEHAATRLRRLDEAYGSEINTNRGKRT